MYYEGGVVLLIVCIVQVNVVVSIDVIDTQKSSSNGNKPNSENELKIIECQRGDTYCLKDRIGFEAIALLHSQIDDDQDGGLNRAESAEFIRDDLKHEGNSENFHGNDDFITVYDLWQMWTKSQVYNWTTNDVVTWLEDNVELAQYATSFRSNNIDGRVLPRLASNYQSIVMAIGVKNPVHKQKLTVKATDVVLFGPPKSKHSFLKDLLLVTSVVVAVGGCYLAYIQHHRAKSHVQKLMKDLSSLQNAEDALSQMQQQLELARKAQRTVVDDKEALERKLRDEISNAKTEAERLRHQRESKEEEFMKLRLAEEELIQVRHALYEAERQLEERLQTPFANLQQWLQLTYEVETKYFEEKRLAAEKQLLAAKEMCDKIRRQKGKFLGSLRVAHSASLDETDSKILSVRAALEDIKVELHERTQRWKQIENICGFNIMTNPGIPFLDSLLRGSTTGSSQSDCSLIRGRSSSNFAGLDNTDDEVASVMLPRTIHGIAGLNQSDVRERKGTGGFGSTASLLHPIASQNVRATPSPSLRARTRAQPTETGSLENLVSDKSVIFDLGGESSVHADDDQPVLSKSQSEPDQVTGAATSEFDSQDGTSHDGNTSSHSGDGSGTEDRKKKTAFTKFLHMSKQKSA